MEEDLFAFGALFSDKILSKSETEAEVLKILRTSANSKNTWLSGGFIPRTYKPNIIVSHCDITQFDIFKLFLCMGK